jgi:hypothetical protein
MKTVREKLEGLPSINYVSLFQNEERSKILEGCLKSAGIEKFVRHRYDLFENTVLRLEGPRINETTNIHKGAITSHLLTIRKWLRETDEPYTLICEDDFSIETVPYWNFTWKEFFSILPEDWECFQFVQIQEMEYRKMKIHERGNFDWSVCCYMITREYAKKLIERTVKDGIFVIDYDRTIPGIEHVIYEGIGKVYSFPLFVENSFLGTSAKMSQDYREEIHRLDQAIHRKCHLHVLDWWKSEGINTDVREIRL